MGVAGVYQQFKIFAFYFGVIERLTVDRYTLVGYGHLVTGDPDKFFHERRVPPWRAARAWLQYFKINCFADYRVVWIRTDKDKLIFAGWQILYRQTLVYSKGETRSNVNCQVADNATYQDDKQ